MTTIAVPGTSGEVIWSYQSEKSLVYVVDDTFGGFPVEARASQVHGKVTPWRELYRWQLRRQRGCQLPKGKVNDFNERKQCTIIPHGAHRTSHPSRRGLV